MAWATKQLRRLLPIAVVYLAINLFRGTVVAGLISIPVFPALAIRSAWSAAP